MKKAIKEPAENFANEVVHYRPLKGKQTEYHQREVWAENEDGENVTMLIMDEAFNDLPDTEKGRKGWKDIDAGVFCYVSRKAIVSMPYPAFIALVYQTTGIFFKPII